MSNINEIILLEIDTLKPIADLGTVKNISKGRQPKGDRDPNRPWILNSSKPITDTLNINPNGINPHLNVRPISTAFTNQVRKQQELKNNKGRQTNYKPVAHATSAFLTNKPSSINDQIRKSLSPNWTKVRNWGQLSPEVKTDSIEQKHIEDWNKIKDISPLQVTNNGILPNVPDNPIIPQRPIPNPNQTLNTAWNNYQQNPIGVVDSSSTQTIQQPTQQEQPISDLNRPQPLNLAQRRHLRQIRTLKNQLSSLLGFRDFIGSMFDN